MGPPTWGDIAVHSEKKVVDWIELRFARSLMSLGESADSAEDVKAANNAYERWLAKANVIA